MEILFIHVNFSQAQYLEDPNINPASPGSNVSINNALKGLFKDAPAAAGDMMVGGFIAIICGILNVIAMFCKYLLLFSAWLIDLVLNPLNPSIYNFTTNELVVQGWIIVRDVCNLFFLLILLFTAICTILRIEKYHAKRTLLMLIIMALLINFSKSIAIFIFDGSQLLMNFFLSQMTNQGPSTLYSQAARIAEIVYDNFGGYWGQTNQSGIMIAVQYLFIIIFLFLFAIALLVTAIFLLIRIVAVMLLIIISPFAFFAAIIPDFSKISSKWWSALFEYSYYGPAAAFFLLLGTKLSFVLNTQFNNVNTNMASGMEISLIKNIVQYLTTLIFLYASIIMAKQFGGGAGAALTNWGNYALKGSWFRKGGWPREVFSWGARVTGASDAYQGIKGGISQRPGWRMLTKEGREAKSKERQENWKELVAPFDIKQAKKKSDERKNDSEESIRNDYRRGRPDAILQAASRGGSLAADMMEDTTVQQTLDRYPDLRSAVYKSLRDNGQHHLQISDEIRRAKAAAGPAGISPAEMNKITEGMFKNSSPSAIFSDPDIEAILKYEGEAGGDYLLKRLLTMNDPQMLARLKANVKNPNSARILDKLIQLQEVNPKGINTTKLTRDDITEARDFLIPPEKS